MPVSGASVVELAGGVYVDLSCVIRWIQSGTDVVVWLESDSFELGADDRPIEVAPTITVDAVSFEAAMQNYLDSLVVVLGYLITEDGKYIITEDGDYLTA